MVGPSDLVRRKWLCGCSLVRLRSRSILFPGFVACSRAAAGHIPITVRRRPRKAVNFALCIANRSCIRPSPTPSILHTPLAHAVLVVTVEFPFGPCSILAPTHTTKYLLIRFASRKTPILVPNKHVSMAKRVHWLGSDRLSTG